MDTLVAVILSGGSGMGLWPLARGDDSTPCPPAGRESMLQASWRRVAPLIPATSLVVTPEQHGLLVAEQLRQVGCTPAAILLEPAGRNTAPAVAVAALQAIASGIDPLLLVLPADHVLQDPAGFCAAVHVAKTAACAGRLVAFGVVPTGPDTRFGYIRADEGCGLARHQVETVASFVERPDAARARSFVASGEYLWNTGIFLFRASVYLAQLARHQPSMLAICRDALANATRDDQGFVRLGLAAFSACLADSIEYAVMEKTTCASVLQMDVGWRDVRSWAALRNLT